MINTSLLIAVDAGKDTTKYVYKNELGILQKESFRTKVQEANNFGADVQGKTFKVKLEDKNYLVGDMVSESKLNYDLSKTSIEHKLCVYVAIAKVVIETGINKVKLAVGIPANIYKNEQLKNEYKQYIFGNGHVNISLNNHIVDFEIKDICILPEAISLIYNDLNEYRKSRTTVIDIGGLNATICRINNLVPNLDEILVCNKGANILKNKVAEALSVRYGITIYKDDVDSILEDSVLYIKGKPQEGSRVIIKDLMKNHIADIVNFAKQNEMDIFSTNGKVIFSGGGSILMKEILSSVYSYCKIVTDSQFANALGFYKILSIKNEG